MTEGQKEQLLRIAKARQELAAALASHDHVQDSDSGCAVCGDLWGQPCEGSPDGRCHYFTVTGTKDQVRLSDGSVAPCRLMEPRFQSERFCLFCGLPMWRDTDPDPDSDTKEDAA